MATIKVNTLPSPLKEYIHNLSENLYRDIKVEGITTEILDSWTTPHRGYNDPPEDYYNYEIAIHFNNKVYKASISYFNVYIGMYRRNNYTSTFFTTDSVIEGYLTEKTINTFNPINIFE